MCLQPREVLQRGLSEKSSVQHKKMCKKRLAELRDDDLFKQPDESHEGECPICCLPLPIDVTKYMMAMCCSKRICRGCDYANQKRESQAGLKKRCAFCRETAPTSFEESRKRMMERSQKNCPVAMAEMGKRRRSEGDYETALEYLTKSAELGDAEAHCQLGYLYHNGDGVEKDMKKAVYHWEEAAIGGHVIARSNLGIHERQNNGKFDRAAKHFIIAANLGDHDSLQKLEEQVTNGHASKEEYDAARRGYQAAVDATKSQLREEAEHFRQWLVQRGERNWTGTGQRGGI